MYQLLNRQVCQLKNEIHGVLLDNGIRDRVLGTRFVERPAKAARNLERREAMKRYQQSGGKMPSRNGLHVRQNTNAPKESPI